ncbi:BTB/POZ domain-containing protein [Ditylenchus destructor]|uniref:BTB/POZ domain-containing protein n=1 Tax=Ditylenchus destructor TaxID=166010 RepID=A0AAD4MJP1_9BILA|nr:BTB/POZ domain-containing protein [Ditylenchus destructor]
MARHKYHFVYSKLMPKSPEKKKEVIKSPEKKLNAKPKRKMNTLKVAIKRALKQHSPLYKFSKLKVLKAGLVYMLKAMKLKFSTRNLHFVFQTTKDTLSARCPESFLARLVNGELPSDKDDTGAYLIDRSYEHFDTILNYLRSGVLHLNENKKATKELLDEADFYNIQPLVEEIGKAMRNATNRSEMVIVSKVSRCVYIGPTKVSYIGYLLLSEKREDYEVLQALLKKVEIKFLRDKEDCCMYYIINANETYKTWMNIELTLRSFGFVQESKDDTYDKWSYNSRKFVRTVRH